ncbi:hypothetical protein [Nonomuraea sp. NPDC049607]|uniref:hypothetical protein n=1 Tax=Nonomuraea sp. NPDC049607 TaxID=3154732 RepID=UPI00341293D5
MHPTTSRTSCCSTTSPFDPLVELGIGKSAKKQLSLLPVGRLQVNTAAAALRRYCLISRPRDGLVSIHRLVQAVTLDQLTPSQRAAWSAAAANILLALPASRRSPGAEAGLLECSLRAYARDAAV